MAAISSQLSNRENKVDRGPRRAAFSPTANQYRGSKLIRPIYLRVFDLGPSDQTRSGRSEDVFHAFQLSGTLSSRYQMRYRVSADSAVSATPRSRRERPRVLCGVERARYYYYYYFFTFEASSRFLSVPSSPPRSPYLGLPSPELVLPASLSSRPSCSRRYLCHLRSRLPPTSSTPRWTCLPYSLPSFLFSDSPPPDRVRTSPGAQACAAGTSSTRGRRTSRPG